MSQLERDDPIATWFGGPPEHASDALLEGIFQRTRRSRQRPVIVAILAGTPTMSAQSYRSPSIRIVVVVSLLLAAITIVLAVAGALLDRDPRLVQGPTPLASEDPASFAPTPSTDATIAPVLAGSPSTFVIAGSRAMFSAATSSAWSLPSGTGADAGEIRIVTRTALQPNFDVQLIEWITVKASPVTLSAAEAELRAAGWTSAPEPIDSATFQGVAWRDDRDQSVPPTALIAGSGLTYRVTVHSTQVPGTAAFTLDLFIRGFKPLGPVTAQAAYLDGEWRFAFVNEATGNRFQAPDERGAGVTRFEDVACLGPSPKPCDEFVDVVRLPNLSPFPLTLPDGRIVSLPVESGSNEYVRLAASWEANVGTSLGSWTSDWQGVLSYYVDNVTMQALFVHRGDQWLAILSAESDVAPEYSRLDIFLKGFLLEP